MKKSVIFIIVFISFMFLHIEVYATQTDTTPSVSDYLPEQLIEMLEQNNISSDINEIADISVSEIFEYLFSIVKNEITTPFVMVFISFVTIIIISISSNIGNDFLCIENKSALSIVAVLSVYSIFVLPVISVIDKTRVFIENISAFIKTFSPSLSAILLVTGHKNVASGYQITLLIAVEILTNLILYIILPLIFIFLAISVVTRIVPNFSFMRFAKSSKTVIVWILSLSSTLFVSLITIKGTIGAGADSLALRVGRFFLGNFVPVVGAALSEAASSVQTGFGVIKNGVGIYGIIGGLLIIIPQLIRIILFKIACTFVSFLSECLGVEEISILVKEISDILSIIMAIILSLGLVFILSTAVTLSLGGK